MEGDRKYFILSEGGLGFFGTTFDKRMDSTSSFVACYRVLAQDVFWVESSCGGGPPRREGGHLIFTVLERGRLIFQDLGGEHI